MSSIVRLLRSVDRVSSTVCASHSELYCASLGEWVKALAILKMSFPKLKVSVVPSVRDMGMLSASDGRS